MSAVKLIIQKSEDGIDIKYLHITIKNEEYSNYSKTEFSEWMDDDGQSQEKKKAKEKSHLVVKIVSGEEISKFDLDSCAKANVSSNVYHEINCNSTINRDEINCNKILEDNNINYSVCPKHENHDNIANGLLNPNINNNSTSSSEFLSPLEYSIKKVQENNAKIMENIQMLNKTLNYTKQREILDSVGPKSMRSYPCNICGKIFVYETGLRRHYSMRHAMTEIQPKWQIVWTCLQCFQVWPRQDHAIKHASSCCKTISSDCVREIKTSLLLQCEFCEKVFTSIPRLLRHSKQHTISNNYECNACGLAFTSYIIAEQHFNMCPCLKTYYSFSLPKMLLCNACDRKFRNYDQLYNHRYKVGHFITKTHSSNHTSMKTLSILVYQCEMCGECFNSILMLKAHRSQFHPNCETGIVQYTNEENTLTPQCHNYYDACPETN